jgi:hypothetical protein
VNLCQKYGITQGVAHQELLEEMKKADTIQDFDDFL